MEDRHSRNSSDAFATELSQLLPCTCIDIDKAVHITDHQSLSATTYRGRVSLPVWAQNGHPAPGLVVMRYYDRRREFFFA